MKHFKLVILLFALSFLGGLANYYSILYMRENEKTPEACIAQLWKHYESGFGKLTEDDRALIEFGFLTYCADAGNDYKIAIKRIDRKSRHWE